MAIEDYNFFGEDFPAIDWSTVTPSDSVNITDGDGNEQCPRSIWVGTGGNIALVSKNGNVVTIQSVPNGTLLPVQPQRINDTNTTASNIVALF